MALRVGVIGGTGLYTLGPAEPIDVETPWGDVVLQRTKLGGRETFFLPRHGARHERPAHRVNHRAHVAALAAAHCDYTIGVNNVGALSAQIPPGSWAVVGDFVSHHGGPPVTFFDDRAVHVDFQEPYCPTLSDRLAKSLPASAPRVVYAGVDGPRFETRSEVVRLAAEGAHVVGMTGVPEAVLAHERGLCYAGLAFVANASLPRSGRLSAKRIQQGLRSRQAAARKILAGAIRRLPPRKRCHCADAARDADVSIARKMR